jgi:hypothetical protein
MRQRLVIIPVIAIGLVAGTGFADQALMRTFPEHKCQFTLPDNDWSWRDGLTVDAIFIASKSTEGLLVALTSIPLRPGEALDAAYVTSYEKGFAASGAISTRGGHFATFQGLPCYQVEVLSPGEKTMVARLVFANGRAYQLMLVSEGRPLPPVPTVENIMNGFAFTAPPSPDPAGTSWADGIAEWIGKVLAGCVLITVFVFVVRWMDRSSKRAGASAESTTSNPASRAQAGDEESKL